MDSIKALAGRKILFFLLTIGGPSFLNLFRSFFIIRFTTSCPSIVDFGTLKSISSIHPWKIHSISQTIPGATVYYVQNIDFKGWKCGSPEGGFAASYGDRYGLHSGAADKGPLYGMGSSYWGAFEKFGLGRR